MNNYQEAIKRINKAIRGNSSFLNLSSLGSNNRFIDSIQQQYFSSLSNDELGNLLSKIALKLPNLSQLDLSYNGLNSLPESISELQNLSRLDLSHNKLNSLPESISKLQSLSRLDLRNNQLNNLPESISKLQSLSRLDLEYNTLSNLPENILQLQNLSELYLSNNELSSLPKDISQLQNLFKFNLDYNKLSSLPESISQLKNLFRLDLRNNRLSSLPEDISQLQSLSEFYLSNNRLSNLPESILQLKNIFRLDLRNNQLNSLPEDIWKLQNLSDLDLENNQLNSLPESISQLKNISKLYLSKNKFEISPEIWELPINEQIQEILKWQKAKAANTLQPIHEAKAIFIGESNFGKTHLIELLREKEIKRTINTTHGIERSKLQIPYENDTIDLNIWDLGGQEFMRSTHQFFFSERTLYVLVTLARRERNELNHWLKLANQLGKNAPILVVINKIDVNDHDIDRASLQRDYPNIKDFVRTTINDCDETTALDSINQLYHKIQTIVTNETLMPSVFEKRRPEWFAVKKSLESLEDDYISYERYRELEHIKTLPEDEQKRNLKLLSILGTVVSYVDDLRLASTHVINPQWIMDGVYKIINDTIIKDKNKGRFDISELGRVLPKDRFPYDSYFFLLNIMKKFKLCYPTKDNSNIYLIPDLFEDIEPKYDWNENDNTIIFRFNYDDFSPDSFMTQFIVDAHDDDDDIIKNDLVWRSGIYITNYTCRAKIYQSFSKNYINIEIKGNLNECRSYLYHIRETFKKLHKPFPEMKIKQEVPYKGEWLNYERLLKLEFKNKPYYHTELDEDIPVSEILNGYALSIERNKDLERLERKIDNIQKTVTNTNSLLTFALTETSTIQYPNIFTLKPKRVSVRNQSDFTIIYELQLYCFDGHKVGKPYDVTKYKDWIKQLIPYYNGMLKMMKFLSVFMLVGAYEMLKVEDFSDNKQNLKAGQSIIDKASNIEESTNLHAYQPRPATQGEMEVIQKILDKVDPNKSWKNELHKVNRDGKIVWVCSEHR